MDQFDPEVELTLNDLYVMSVEWYTKTNKYFKRHQNGQYPKYESLMTNEVVTLPKEEVSSPLQGEQTTTTPQVDQIKWTIKYVDPYEALRYLMKITEDPPQLKDAPGSNLVAVLCPNGA